MQHPARYTGRRRAAALAALAVAGVLVASPAARADDPYSSNEAFLANPVPPPAFDPLDPIIDNGSYIQLGINPAGNFNVPGGTASRPAYGTTDVGLRYMPTNADGTAPGSPCEGWGVANADAATGTFTGYANDCGSSGLTVQPGTGLYSGPETKLKLESQGTRFKSVTTAANRVRVTQDYHPSSSPNLYEDTVTVDNIGSAAIGDLRFRRVMDWDIAPTTFSEWVTIHVGTAANVVRATNNGFASADPLTTPGGITVTPGSPDYHAGPSDQGASFDFTFGRLEAGASRTFSIYYGAAGNREGALAAAASVGAEVYSLGLPTINGAENVNENAFVFAFKGVGGTPIAPDTTPPVTTDDAPGGWSKTPVTVHLTATDGASGVSATHYTLDGGADQTGTTIAVTGDGQHTITYYSVDKAGNSEAPHTTTVDIDGTPPTIDGARSPAANAAGWNNTSVDVKFTCGDATSPVVSCGPDQTLLDETQPDGQSVSGTAADSAGNTANASVGPIRIDKTKPTLTGTATTAPNALGWYRGDVTIAWHAADGLSGVDPASQPADSVIDGEGADLQAGPKTVTDLAGNESDATYSEKVNIDRTPPTITGSTIPASPNAAGWFNGPVTVHFACDDALSKIQECTGDHVLNDDGVGQSQAGSATDNADNTASATVSGIRIDSHAPTTIATLECSGSGGYCNSTTAKVRFQATDPAPVAGVVSSGVAAVQYRVGTVGDWTTVPGDDVSADVGLSGSGTQTVQYRAIDAAGNIEDTGQSVISFDTIAPTVTHSLSPEANAAGWNHAATTVHFAATDDTGGSGVDAPTVTPDQTVADETAGQTVSGQATDKAGNVGHDSVVVKLDKTSPTISATPSGTQGANGWYTTAVTVSFSCADPGSVASGVASCSAPQVLHDGESATGTAKDNADNTGTASFGPVKVDTQPPTINVAGVQNGAIYTVGAVPAASCTATDVGRSGIDGACSVTISGGRPNGVGTYSYVATAKDMAGNAATVTGSYQVRYAVKNGTAFWLQPINDTAHTTGATTSVFKAGSTIPAKFRLFDASGNPIQANAAPTWIAPVRGKPMAQQVDEAAYGAIGTTGDVFGWSTTDRQYQYNWASPATGAGYYWRIGAALDDGTTQTISIGLR